MKSRHESMGGRVEEVNALENLEGLRQKLIDRCSYNNEKNAAAFRHLLGGRKDGLGAAVNNYDLNNSVVHWQLDLRYYNP